MKKISEENLKFRRKLWLEHGHEKENVYEGEGQMQCPKCGLDFKNDTIEKISRVLMGVDSKIRMPKGGN